MSFFGANKKGRNNGTKLQGTFGGKVDFFWKSSLESETPKKTTFGHAVFFCKWIL